MAKWCNMYNCWCSDAEDMFGEENMCDFECSGCDEQENV